MLGANFELVSVAMDAGGIQAARPWVERARATFPTVADSQNQLMRTYDFRLVPNGIVLDSNQIIRFRKVGGFSCENEADRSAIARLLRGDVSSDIAVSPVETPDEAVVLKQELTAISWRLGLELRNRGDVQGAATAWRKALWHDPENFVIRKQIWTLLYPEKFGDEIDYGWQQEQLAAERAAECGVDGCELPASP